MGCWNETCVLTRLPIFVGDKIVALHAFEGVSCDGRNASSFTPLMMGLPLIADYDDYGGFENPGNPALAGLIERALATNRFFKRHALEKRGGCDDEIYVAAGERAFFAAEHELAPLFYYECGVLNPDHDDHGYGEAYRKAKESLDCFGKELAAAALPHAKEELDRSIMAMLVKSFGADKAWAALTLLRKHLFPRCEPIYIHESAYRAVVEHTGAQLLHYYGEEEKLPLRSFLSQQLDAWAQEYREYRADRLQMASELAATKPEAALRFSDPATTDMLAPRNNYLGPLTAPWTASKAPLVGHFWGAIDLEEILAAVPREEILDALVFQWGRSSLRVDFYKPAQGSQNSETELPRVVFDRTYGALKAKGLLQSDFYDCLHR